MDTLIILSTPSTDYLSTNYCPKKYLSNIPKKGMSTLNGARRRLYCSSTWMGYKGALQHEATTRKAI